MSIVYVTEEEIFVKDDNEDLVIVQKFTANPPPKPFQIFWETDEGNNPVSSFFRELEISHGVNFINDQCRHLKLTGNPNLSNKKIQIILAAPPF